MVEAALNKVLNDLCLKCPYLVGKDVMFSAEEFSSSLVAIMDLFPDHYAHIIEEPPSCYANYLKGGKLHLHWYNTNLIIYKGETKAADKCIWHDKWYIKKNFQIPVKIIHNIVNGHLSVSKKYPWPVWFGPSEFDNFWLNPDPLPELQLKLVKAIFGKEWSKYIRFDYEITTTITTTTITSKQITSSAEKLA